jgi:hypothetical protein
MAVDANLKRVAGQKLVQNQVLALKRKVTPKSHLIDINKLKSAQQNCP